MKYESLNFDNKFSKFSEQWSPKVIAEMNDYQFKLVKIKGDFVWHDHKDTDEVFMVLSGEIAGISKQKISINSASAGELDTLPGIGEKRAASIINSRPYSKIEDLVLHKIIPQSVFDQIKNDLSL